MGLANIGMLRRPGVQGPCSLAIRGSGVSGSRVLTPRQGCPRGP